MNGFLKKYNYDDVFIRNITLGVISEFNNKIRWENTFDNYKRLVTIPVYYGLIDERFGIDSFIDDIIGSRPELNTDPIPRAVITLTTPQVKRNEILNPNVNLTFEKLEDDGTLKLLKGKFRVIPIQITYDIELHLNTETDVWKCTQSIWDWLFNYKYFYVTYNSFRINCVYQIPDNIQADIQRQIDISTNTIKKINISFDVHTNYPIPHKESKPLSVPCNKLFIKGEIRSFDKLQNNRTFIGDNVNRKK